MLYRLDHGLGGVEQHGGRIGRRTVDRHQPLVVCRLRQLIIRKAGGRENYSISGTTQLPQSLELHVRSLLCVHKQLRISRCLELVLGAANDPEVEGVCNVRDEQRKSTRSARMEALRLWARTV